MKYKRCKSFRKGFSFPHPLMCFRKARERMLESTRTRDGGKEAEAQGWGGACAFRNGCGGGGAANWDA